MPKGDGGAGGVEPLVAVEVEAVCPDPLAGLEAGED